MTWQQGSGLTGGGSNGVRSSQGSGVRSSREAIRPARSQAHFSASIWQQASRHSASSPALSWLAAGIAIHQGQQAANPGWQLDPSSRTIITGFPSVYMEEVDGLKGGLPYPVLLPLYITFPGPVLLLPSSSFPCFDSCLVPKHLQSPPSPSPPLRPIAFTHRSVRPVPIFPAPADHRPPLSHSTVQTPSREPIQPVSSPTPALQAKPPHGNLSNRFHLHLPRFNLPSLHSIGPLSIFHRPSSPSCSISTFPLQPLSNTTVGLHPTVQTSLLSFPIQSPSISSQSPSVPPTGSFASIPI